VSSEPLRQRRVPDPTVNGHGDTDDADTDRLCPSPPRNTQPPAASTTTAAAPITALPYAGAGLRTALSTLAIAVSSR
jgi:hypothetical protein